MEAFEHVTKVWLETKGYAVTSGVKFPVRLKTKKTEREEFQTHGYEIDLVAARNDELILVSVKSFFGSHGFSFDAFNEESLFGRREVLEGILLEAQNRYGYPRKAIQIWLAVGRFRNENEMLISEHLAVLSQRSVPMRIVKLEEIVDGIITAAHKKTYLDDPVIVTLKCLIESKRLA
jgi:hypothetical protein